jgi:hypothetical protein
MSLQDVKKNIAILIFEGSNTPLLDAVVKREAEKVIESRVLVAIKAVAAYNIALKNVTSLSRPDQKMFDSDGKEVLFTTPKRREEQGKAASALKNLDDKFSGAINARPEESDAKWNELEKHLGNPPKEAE